MNIWIIIVIIMGVSVPASFIDVQTGRPGRCKQNKCQPEVKVKETNIAQAAAMEAKAAQEAQQAAGQQASAQVKGQLADKAIQAAKAAEAAWMGKSALVEQLEQQLKEAEAAAQEEENSAQQAEQVVLVATQAAQQAQALFKLLQDAVVISKSNTANACQTAQGAQVELTEKQKLVEAARSHVEDLLRQLKIARDECAITKAAAQSAHGAAEVAKENVDKMN